MAHKVMRHRAGPAFLERQARLRAIQCLHLALLITAQDESVFGYVQVKAPGLAKLCRRCCHSSEHFGQRTLTPLRRLRWTRAQSFLHDQRLHFRAIIRLHPRPGASFSKPARPNSGKRAHHREAFCRLIPKASPICSWFFPSATSKTSRHRSARRLGHCRSSIDGKAERVRVMLH